MRKPKFTMILAAFPVLAVMLLFAIPAIALVNPGQNPSVASAQQQCIPLNDPSGIPAATLINFDDLPNAAVIADHYRQTFGVTFEDGRQTQAITYGLEPEKAHSAPNVAINNPILPGDSAGVPMHINFDEPKIKELGQ